MQDRRHSAVMFNWVSIFRTGFWVSKKSLQKWKVLAQKVQEQFIPNGSTSSPEDSKGNTSVNESAKKETTNSNTVDETKSSKSDESPEVVDMDVDGKPEMSGSDVGSAGIDEKELKFNQDLLCEHGKYNVLLFISTEPSEP